MRIPRIAHVPTALGFILAVLGFGFAYESGLTTWALVFFVGLLLFVTGLNAGHKKSIIRCIKDKNWSKIFILIGFGITLGFIIEVLGQVVFDAWYYPPLQVLGSPGLLLLPSWGVFGILTHETFHFVSNFIKNIALNTVVSAVILMVFLEGINLFTQSWQYTESFNNLALWFVGWVILISVYVNMPHKYKIYK